MFESMRRLRIPSQDQIDAVAGQAVYMVESLASLVPSGEGGVPPDLKDEAERAGSATSLVGMMGSAVGVFENMRRLRIPSQDQIDAVAGRTVGMVNAIASFAPDNGDALAEAGRWADDAAKLVNVAAGGVNLLKSLRRFRGPAVEDVQEFMVACI